MKFSDILETIDLVSNCIATAHNTALAVQGLVRNKTPIRICTSIYSYKYNNNEAKH